MLNEELQKEENVYRLLKLYPFKKFRTAAPTFEPKSFIDQIQFVDDGAKKVYFYFNGSWSYITLT